ncbi:hypothetical protein EP47_11690 [Legionella norrlandica]|uniref:Teneurin-like YD-shell domain-containing protein n=1 Tax=Legionella norrlandica TaxID=1498499 RepID=A0A0A2SUK7_9GAMM|nr:RHS repeat protein [Legionella norrlandica]KGP64422.1 hypothetical protein EP47_11690 [Legionella norrlandica]
MVQIFTGEGLGIRGSSLGLGSYGPKGIASLGQGNESVYINAANGNLVLCQADGFIAGLGFGLDLFQTYNSRGESASNWYFNMESRLVCYGEANCVGSFIIRTDEDGHCSRYLFDANKNSYLPEAGGTASITFRKNCWVYHEGSQKTSYYYNQQGQLSEIKDLDGHSVSFHYSNGHLDSITDKNNQQKITWSFKNGLLTDLTTSSEGKMIHHLHYSYDDRNRLHQVSRDLGGGKTYWISYNYAEDSNWIIDIRQSDGTSLHIDYDAQGRVKKIMDGEGRTSLYDYGEGKTTITNGLGESWIYYYDSKNRLTGIDGPEQYKIRYHYEGKYLSSVVQGNQIWRFSYNDDGDCIRIEEPSGQVIQRMYDSNHRLVSETHYQSFDGSHHPGKPQTTRYVYDDRGHLLFVIKADGSVTEHRYDENGQLASSRCYLNSIYDLSNTHEDELLTSAQIQLWINHQTPQDISLIEYHYDWRGQLTEEIHYEQVDNNGQGMKAGALITRSRYDAAGRLVEKSTPTEDGWSITQYLYDDLGRLIQTIDNQNHCQRIEYDDTNHRIIQTDANGLQTVRIYDHSGLLLSITRMDRNHCYGTTTYQYDASGHLIAETGINGLTKYLFYDHQGRLLAEVSISGQVIEYQYNEEGKLIRTHQYEQRVLSSDWRGKPPAYEKIKPRAGSLDRINQTIYNQYGQVAYRIDRCNHFLPI